MHNFNPVRQLRQTSPFLPILCKNQSQTLILNENIQAKMLHENMTKYHSSELEKSLLKIMALPILLLFIFQDSHEL
ncbi:hypothetical protein WN48_03889 [Eufriesea mexicana]|nr:hypothetical protein WN48_03889 [Eufriesea mexicana]